MFIESDTGKTFYASGAVWVEKLNTGYSTTAQGTPAGGATGQLLRKNSVTTGDYSWATVSGTGDVAGPIVAVASQIALFDGITGKLIKADTTTGIVKSTAGVISGAVGDTDYALPATVALKAPLASPTFTGTVTIPSAQITNANLLTIATKTYKGRTSAATGVVEDVPVATLKTDLVLVKGDVGLGNVDNTADTAKPVSTAQQTALNSKANLLSPTFTGTPTLPTGTIATTQTAGTNSTTVATTAFVTAINNNASYRTILQASGSHIAGRAIGTYGMGAGDPIAISGTGTLYPLSVIQVVSADYPTINGITTKLRIRAQLYTNDVAPTGNYTFGLYPITRPAVSGGAGLAIYTLGTVVTGSNGATFTAPAVDLLGSAVGADFAIPADGAYVIGIVTTAIPPASAHVHVNAQLQIRNT